MIWEVSRSDQVSVALIFKQEPVLLIKMRFNINIFNCFFLLLFFVKRNLLEIISGQKWIKLTFNHQTNCSYHKENI